MSIPYLTREEKSLADSLCSIFYDSIVNELNQSGYTTTFIKADVTKAADWKNAADQTLANFGKIDILVNNAGWTYRRKDTLEVTEAEYDREFWVRLSRDLCVALTRISFSRHL